MLAAALSALLAVPAPAAEDSWPVTQTAHFTVHHEGPGVSLGDDAKAEQVYEALHEEVWPLVPWLASEKTQLYLYQDVDSYRAGRFHPPAWSGGLMRDAPGERAIVLFEPLDTGILAHELGHLYLHSAFAGSKAPPPPWLDEGLASLLQARALSLPDPRDRGPILSSPLSLSEFLKTRPLGDPPGAWIHVWYGQAQSLVWFLKRAHVPSLFADFCAALKGGAKLEDALRDVYGYPSVEAFDADWRRWRPTVAPGRVKGIGDQ